RGRDASLDGLGANGPLHPGDLQIAGDRFDANRRRRGNRDRVVDRHTVVPRPVHRPYVDAARVLVDFDVDAGELARIAVRPLDRLDGDLISRTACHDDVAREVGDADAAVSADLDPAGEALGLLGTAAALIGCARKRPTRAHLASLPDG